MSPERAKPLVIGIAGGTASGKTTLALRLAQSLEALRVEVFSMDRYFRPIKPKMTAPYTGIAYEDHNSPASFDLEQLVRDLDHRLLAQDGPQIIIVEGLMTLQDDGIRSRLDLRLFIDTQSDERIVRRLKRNMARGMAFDEIATFFLDTVRYRHQEFVEPSRWHADLVLNGSQTSPKGIELILEWVRSHAPQLDLSDTDKSHSLSQEN